LNEAASISAGYGYSSSMLRLGYSAPSIDEALSHAGSGGAAGAEGSRARDFAAKQRFAEVSQQCGCSKHRLQQTLQFDGVRRQQRRWPNVVTR
jgi:hypothetical protein